MIDFSKISEIALANSLFLLRSWLPDGIEYGSQWVCRNPRREDRTPGSFTINHRTGVWKDFAIGQGGKDLIALKAYLEELSQSDAAKAILRELDLGIPSDSNIIQQAVESLKWHEKYNEVSSFTSFQSPTDYPIQMCHSRLGKPSRIWKYSYEDNSVPFYICRFETEEGKEIRPYSWNGSRWSWKLPRPPLPLFNLSLLKKSREPVVMVVEGEKAVCSCIKLFPCTTEVVVATWVGGCSAWKKTDWSPLKNRHVVIWPDNDSIGIKTAKAIKRHLLVTVGSEKVFLVKIPTNFPKGWDAADALSEGWNQDKVIDLFSLDNPYMH